MRLRNMAVLLAACSAAALAACAEDALFVDNVRGDDSNPGSREKPFRSIAAGLRRLGGGGVLKLVPNAEPYHEALPLRSRHSGSREGYTVVDGMGATIDGMVPPEKGGWKDEGDGVWSRRLDNNAWVMDAQGFWSGAFPIVRFGTVDGVCVTSRADLAEGAYFLYKRRDRGPGHNTLFVKTAGGRSPDDVPLSVVSPWMNVSMYGCEFVKVMNVNVRNQSWDCLSSGSCTNCFFENVDGSRAMDQGISAHGSVALTVRNSRFHDNAGGGIVDVNVPNTRYCQTTYEDCLVVSNCFRCPVEFHGHSDGAGDAAGDYRLVRCVVKDNDLLRSGGFCIRSDREARVVCEDCTLEGRSMAFQTKGGKNENQ